MIRAGHGQMWRKNILGEGKFLVGPRLNVQKQKGLSQLQEKRGEQYVHIWQGCRGGDGPHFGRVLPCNQGKMFWFYSKFSEMLLDRLVAWEWRDLLNSLSSLSWLLLCGIPSIALLGQCCSSSHIHISPAVLVCWSCCNKMLQTGWCRKVNVYCFTVLEAKSVKSKCQKGQNSLLASGSSLA